MTTRFAIRPKPMNEESLSGYLMRLGYANYMSAKEVFTYIYKKSNTKTIKYRNVVHKVDDFPKNVVCIDILSELTNLNKNIIEAMTFMTVYEKFFDNMELDEKEYLKTMYRQKEVKNRRFCSKCIEIYGYYKLIWQVSDIEICNEHLIKLTDKCLTCGIEQPYLTDELNEFKCFKCGSYLYDVKVYTINESHYIDEQLKRYEQWHYLLDFNKNSFNNIHGLSKIKSLGIGLLYVSKFNCGILKSREIKSIDKSIIYKIVKYINDRTNVMYITVQRLLYSLTYIQLNIDDFFNYNIPEAYVKSIINISKNDNKIYKDSLKIRKKQKLNVKEFYNNKDNHFNEGVIKKVERYIGSLESSGIKINCYNVYSNIKIDERRIYNKYPYLSRTIHQHVSDYEIRRQDFLIEKHSKMISKVIKEMYINEEKITYKSISEKIGISIMTVKRSEKLIEVISKMKDSL
ncbi:TniQ family protein [Clostridium tagluense]|uniref:TniQ domain-containing protein n=1 Tax=Clostridium tagluense TaxID=360422 RepID=A0A401UTZ0_9CLOT|nr:TniQ family protein [Clostridium tagluense]GCD13015.1 hypothetical protein Ctaglu_46380 [Clostridium tagluense]